MAENKKEELEAGYNSALDPDAEPLDINNVLNEVVDDLSKKGTQVYGKNYNSADTKEESFRPMGAPPTIQDLMRAHVTEEDINALKLQMVGKVEIRAFSEGSWPPDAETWKSGKPKSYVFDRFPKCQSRLVPRPSQGVFQTGIDRKEQLILENMLGVAEGALDPRITNRYWQETMTLNITENGLVLDLEKPSDFIAYRYLMQHKSVAKDFDSRTGYEEYMIFDPQAEAKRKNKLVSHQRKAMAMFSKLTNQQQVAAAILLGKRADTSTPEMIENFLYDQANDEPELFVAALSQPNAKEVVLLKRLIAANIVKQVGSAYKYQEHILGLDESTCAAKLASTEFQPIRIALEGRLQAQLV
jgi:hypothetical protein